MSFEPRKYLPEDMLDEIVALRAQHPREILEAARVRARPQAPPDGRLCLGWVRPAGAVARWETLALGVRAISAPEADGVVASPDMTCDMLALDAVLHDNGHTGFLDENFLFVGPRATPHALGDGLFLDSCDAPPEWGPDGGDGGPCVVLAAGAADAATASGWVMGRGLWLAAPESVYREVADATFLPVLFFPEGGDSASVLERLFEASQVRNFGGVLIDPASIRVGDDPHALLTAASGIVHEDATAREALVVLEETFQRDITRLVGDEQ